MTISVYHVHEFSKDLENLLIILKAHDDKRLGLPRAAPTLETIER